MFLETNNLIFFIVAIGTYVFLSQGLLKKYVGIALLVSLTILFFPLLELSVLMVFAVVSIVIYLFFKEIFPIDVTALVAMGLLILLRLVTPEEGVSGFSNGAVITILAMFILSAGVERTGVIHRLSMKMFRVTGSSQFLQLVVVMLMVAPFSGFLNNAAIVAVLIPFVLNLSKMSKTAPSKLLIPLSYVSMSAGMLTLIGTSTNLLANSVLMRYAEEQTVISGVLIEPFTFFSFWKIGLVVLCVTILYFVLIGYWLLPSRKGKKQVSLFERLAYTFELRIPKNSPLIGQKIRESYLVKKYEFRIVRLQRGKQSWTTHFSNRIIRAGDIISVRGSHEDLINLEDEKGVVVNPHESLSRIHDIQKNLETVQMVIPKGSKYINKTIKGINANFGDKAIVLAVRKGRSIVTSRLQSMKMQFGDMIIVRSYNEATEEITKNTDLLNVEEHENIYKKDKTLIAVVIMAGVVLLAALDIYPILASSLFGVILMLLTGVLNPKEAYQAIRWEVIFLLAGMIPLGIALENTGASTLIAEGLSAASGDLAPLLILIGLYSFTTVLTEVLSNNASVILLLPIGISLADKINMNPYIIVLVIMFAASTSFLTPIGYKTNTMVYGTGVYKFSDFFRVGVLLNIILAILTPILILYMY